jgi:hypothetical protein
MVIADRASGMTYAAIARHHGIPEATIGRWCRKAGYGEGKRPRKAEPDQSYDWRWLKNVFARTKVNATGCFVWQGFTQEKGYGSTSYRGRSRSIHRTVYKIVHRTSLNKDQFVCHTCDNPPCCNPAHLILADNDWNMADKTAKGRHHELRVTHCPLNHPYDAENTYYAPNGSRHCKACKRYQLRLKAGWPEELALHPGRVPAGYTKEMLCQQ